MNNRPTIENQTGFYYGYVVVGAVFMTMVIIWGTFATFGVFFGEFIETFEWSRAATSAASSIRDLVFGFVCILTARAADSFGPRIVITTSGLVLGVGYFLMSQIQTTWQLYLCYGVIISSGMSAYILMLSIVAKWFERRRGMMTAVSLSGMGIGTMVMPPISNSLIAHYGWRTSYIIIAVFAFVVVVLAAQFLKNPSSRLETKCFGFTWISSVHLPAMKVFLIPFQFPFELRSVPGNSGWFRPFIFSFCMPC